MARPRASGSRASGSGGSGGVSVAARPAALLVSPSRAWHACPHVVLDVTSSNAGDRDDSAGASDPGVPRASNASSEGSIAARASVARALPDLVESARAPLDSVTEVNGTVARFEMAYSPPAGERIAFGPPLKHRIASLVFLAFALSLVILVVAAHTGSSNTRLYVWLVEGDRNRPISASVLAAVVALSALGTVVRARMRGVVVHADGLEGRYLLPMGVPRIKRFAWPQVERIVMDEKRVLLELWDGTYERLPEVASSEALGELLERIAAGRKIQVTRLRDLASELDAR